MLKYWDNLYHALDDNSSPITVHLDIAKAFDTINFNFVLQKLARFGFDKEFLKFFASYLVNRQKSVKVADSYSTFSKISSGGPQGSIFAVFLFYVYINDLPDGEHREQKYSKYWSLGTPAWDFWESRVKF